MHSLADQDTRQLGGTWSVLTRQRRDHARLDDLLDQFASSWPGPGQDRILHRIARLVFPHAFAEESVLWPALRRQLPDGHRLTLEVEREHQEVNELWTTLENSPSDEVRRTVIDRLITVLRDDVRDEEDVLLPRLQQVTNDRQLRMLGLAWEVVRRTAPTRPHPFVARRPPGNALAALPLTLIDRTRDLAESASRAAPQLAEPARTLSNALERVAHRVEAMSLFRIGEDPSTRIEVQS